MDRQAPLLIRVIADLTTENNTMQGKHDLSVNDLYLNDRISDMKAAIVDNGKVSVQNVSKPEIGKGGILVRMESCGICGSDLEKVFGSYSKPSTKLGHEPAGTVLEVGSNVQDIHIGDRVFTHHHVSCKQCHLCKSGSETLCEHYSKSNLQPVWIGRRICCS